MDSIRRLDVARRLAVAMLLAVGIALLWAPADASAAEECHILPGGTLGEEEPPPVPDRAGKPTDRGPGVKGANPTKGGLPERVDLKSATASSNRNYYFGLKGGKLYVKPNYERTGKKGSWQHVPAPACLDGDIEWIGADDDELIAINSKKQIFGMDQALSIPSRFNWTSRWGFPFWNGDGFTVPADSPAWSWTVISPRESRYWTDPAGNRHDVGEGKVSHILSVSSDRRRITMNDPWLPRDRSYEVCTPRRGTFKVRNISTSGSVLFVIGGSGDMYTRLWDFDIAGLDNVFFHYSYADQRGVTKPVIQLPGAGWVQQPKVPGKITDRISLTTQGLGTEHRTMRVEGRNAKGVPGFWEKDLYDLNRGSSEWKFTPTPKAKVTGSPIRNSLADTSARGAGPVEEYRYVLAGGGSYSAEIPDFDVYCNRSVLRVNLAEGKSLDLDLYMDDIVRTEPRNRGIDDTSRWVRGTIAVNDSARKLAAQNSEAREFIEGVLGDKQFTETYVDATTSAIKMTDLGLTFERADHSPATSCVVDPGFAKLTAKAKGRKLRFDFATTTESPANVVVSRVSKNGKLIGDRAVARLTRTGSFAWKDRRGGKAAGIYRVTVSSMGRGGRLDAREFAFKRVKKRFVRLGTFSRPRACGILKDFSLSGPAFGKGQKKPALGIRVATDEAATVTIKVRRGSRVVRTVRLGEVDPSRPVSTRLKAKGLKRGNYRLEASAVNGDGRIEKAVLSAVRL